MFKKIIALVMAVLFIFAISGCGEKTNTAADFVEAINESYVNMLRIEATTFTAKVQRLDNSNPGSFSEYLQAEKEMLSQAKLESAEYLSIVEANEAKVSELYNSLSSDSEISGEIKKEADKMYESYQYMLNCVTDDFMSYLSWYEEFPTKAAEFDESMKKIEKLID